MNIEYLVKRAENRLSEEPFLPVIELKYMIRDYLLTLDEKERKNWELYQRKEINKLKKEKKANEENIYKLLVSMVYKMKEKKGIE